MPLFDYQCEKCRHVTEFLESPESRKVHRCEQCGSTRMKKMLSAFSVGPESASSFGGSSSCPTGTCSFS